MTILPGLGLHPLTVERICTREIGVQAVPEYVRCVNNSGHRSDEATAGAKTVFWTTGVVHASSVIAVLSWSGLLAGATSIGVSEGREGGVWWTFKLLLNFEFRDSGRNFCQRTAD